MIKINPFNPTFGDIPELFLQVKNNPQDVANLIRESKFSRSFFITGVRGSGKTVYMTKVTSLITQDKNFIHIDLLNKDGILENFVNKLYYASKSFLEQALSSIETISTGGLSFKFSQTDNLEILLDEIMEDLSSKGKKILITIDEVDDSKPIQEFAQIFAALKRKNYSIFCLMTGLPELVLNIQNNKKLTFLLRSEKIVMAPLNNTAMVQTYQKVFDCPIEIAIKMAHLTAGYSYTFQLLGYLTFEQSPSLNADSIESVRKIYEFSLFDNTYQKIFEGLSELDKQYLIAIQGNKKLEEVCKIMGKDKVFVSQYRRRTIERKLIKPARYGIVEYTLPLFSEYIDAIQDTDSIFYLGY